MEKGRKLGKYDKLKEAYHSARSSYIAIITMSNMQSHPAKGGTFVREERKYKRKLQSRRKKIN